jgi:predicted Zn-ribbon and HTH transcriptional regulator
MGNRVKVKCNRCGKDVYSDEFILDPDYKMMVCQACVREKRTRREVWDEVNKQKADAKRQKQLEAGQNPDEESEEPKPAGWDKEDEILEKLSKQKQRFKDSYVANVVSPGKAKCKRCGFVFKYNEDINKPSACPYCAHPVMPKARF